MRPPKARRAQKITDEPSHTSKGDPHGSQIQYRETGTSAKAPGSAPDPAPSSIPEDTKPDDTGLVPSGLIGAYVEERSRLGEPADMPNAMLVQFDEEKWARQWT